MRLRIMVAAALVAASGLGQDKKAPESQSAAKPPKSAAELQAAVSQAISIVVSMQESYAEPPRKPRRFKTPEDEKAFAEKEKAFEAAQKKAGAAREWPYQGVVRDENGEIPAGYRVAGTCIACWSLIEAPGFADDAPRKDAFFRGFDYVVDQLASNPKLSSEFDGTYDVRGWAHTYGLKLTLRALDAGVLDAGRATTAEKIARRMVKTLEESEIVENGGWNYARGRGAKKPNPPSTFMTAPTLQALFEARAHGIPVKGEVVERALKALEAARLETGAFLYASGPKPKTDGPFEKVPGACARMAACEATLDLAGRSSPDRLRGAVKAFFDHWDELEARRAKPGTHEGPYKIAPYYFHYGHTAVAQAIERLPEQERAPWRTKLIETYWRTREDDGGWNDRIFPRSKGYSTAMTVLGLLTPSLPAPRPWKT